VTSQNDYLGVSTILWNDIVICGNYLCRPHGVMEQRNAVRLGMKNGKIDRIPLFDVGRSTCPQCLNVFPKLISASDWKLNSYNNPTKYAWQAGVRCSSFQPSVIRHLTPDT
jgi:hypothetical protein